MGTTNLDNLALASGITVAGRSNRYLAGAAAAGVCVDHLGPNAAEGMQTFILDETVACSAVENAMTAAVPKGAIIDAVLANCQAALTGGGTTATWSIGITGTVNKYGTAGHPTQADALTKNSKSSRMLASVELTAAETIKVIGSAAGGAAAGNTALTVGSVRVVVIYRAAAALASA